jgi:Holliday junction resolvasome RuvABC ATP-dependent DNA helicase subunit
VGTGPLDVVVTSFVDDVTEALGEATRGIAGVDRSRFRDDVTTEAFNLATAMVDADGRHTDEELNGLIDAFGPRMPDSQLLRALPDQLRNSTLVAGRRVWLESDSQLFGILVDADRRNGTRLSDRYYERALDVAHVVASLDVVPAQSELEAIAALRSRLLAGLRSRYPDARHVPSTPPESATGIPAPTAPTAATPTDAPARPLEELLAELDELVGLEAVKARVHMVADFLRVQQLRAERDLPTVDTSHHLVFTGNPGTGKTTVARLLAQIYRTLGVVARGHLVETDRSGLVAGYVGQTAPLVTARFDEADEGMLFIDEAYTLARGGENDFGREAIDQMVKLMEDRRDRIVLVVAGYPAEMESFLGANPGLRSRFPTVIDFPDYTTDELVRIVNSIGDKQRYELTDAAQDKLRAVLDATPRGRGFGNARLARNLFEDAINRHAGRVMKLDEPPTEADLTTLEPADLPDTSGEVS